MLTRTKVEKMKREAKAMRKDQGTPLHQALDLVAQRAGFHHWKHVAEAAKNMPVPVQNGIVRTPHLRQALEGVRDVVLDMGAPIP